MTCWDVLGIAQTQDRGDIRRAYATRLKATNPEDDSEGFKQLRTAYEQALTYAARGAPAAPPTPLPKRVARPQASPAPNEVESEAPDPHAIDHKAHNAALNRLQAALRAGADPAALPDAFEAVIHSPAMGAIDVRSDTEERIAGVLARNIPRSDPLISPAIDHFHWSSRDVRRRMPRPVSQILQRQKDLGQLRAFGQRYHTHHMAFKALSAPPRPITVRSRLFSGVTAEAVEAFLTDVIRLNPTMRSNLNADSVAIWQAFLSKPHLANWGVWAVVLSGPALILGLLFLTIVPADYRGPGIFTILPPIFALAALAYTFGIDWRQRRWRETRFSAPPWLRWGWAGTTAVMMLATALPFGGWALTAATAVLAAATALWVVIVGEPDVRPTTVPWQLRAMLGELYLGVWGLFAACTLPAAEGWRVIAMLAAVAIASAFARMPLYRLWAVLPVKMRQATALNLALLALVGIVAIWDVQTLPEWRSATVAGVAAIVLAHRAVAVSNPAWLLRIRYFGFIVAAMSAPIFGAVGGLAIGGSILLAWVIALMVRIGLAQRASAR